MASTQTNNKDSTTLLLNKMDLFDCGGHHTNGAPATDCSCTTDLVDLLTAASISHGVDPLHAALDAQLQAPLIQPFLF